MTESITYDPQIAMIAPEQLKVDPDTQRKLDQAHVARLARAFDESLVGLLQVSRRADGDYYVVDGQHRAGAAIAAGRGKVPLRCFVMYDMTKEEEASRFVGVNNGAKRPNALDLFRIRVTAGDPVAVEIAKIVADAGMAIGFLREDGCIAAVAALENVYSGNTTRGGVRGKPQPMLLAETLDALQGAWGNSRQAYETTLLRGMGLLLERHGGEVDRNRLADRLGKAGTPGQIIGRARSMSDITRQSHWVGACQVMVEIYNHGLRGGRLERGGK